MEMPVELVSVLTLVVGGFVVKIVTDGFKALSEVLKFPLGKLGTLVAAAASTFVVAVLIGAINFGLGFVPPEWYPFIQAGFTFLLTILGAMGLHRESKLRRGF